MVGEHRMPVLPGATGSESIVLRIKIQSLNNILTYRTCGGTVGDDLNGLVVKQID